MSKDDDPEFDIRVHYHPDPLMPPAEIYPDPNSRLPPPRWLEHEACWEIMRQYTHFLKRAIRNRDDDPGQMLRVMVRAERLMSEYVDAGFYMLERELEALREHIRIAGRMARRHIIRCALRGDEAYIRDMQEFVRDDEMSREDVRAAEQHLAEGTRLMLGLWPPKAEAERQELQ
jgi:hypothetical protein